MLEISLLLIGMILYAYLGYFILVFVLSIFVDKKVEKAEIYPNLALVIAAYNEEQDIESKILNSLELDYPKENLKIIVVSDGSTDKTDSIVSRFQTRGVELIRIEGRVGKTEARNQALKKIDSEIIVFSDATTIYAKNSLKMLVRNFSDRKVGMVAGRLKYIDPNGSEMGFGQKIFWKYENKIKKCQTKLGTLTGSLGCMTAFRKSYYTDLPSNIIEDFTEPLMFIQKGFRVVYESEAQCFEKTTQMAKEEFSMRVRVIRGGLTGLLYARSVLNPLIYPAASFQLVSHKVIRWLVPVFAILAFISSAIDLIITQTVLSQIIFGLQVLFYSLTALSFIMGKLQIKIPFISLFQYLFVVNLAALQALVKFSTSKLEATWEPQRKLT